MSGVMILSLSTVIVKIIGLAYKIPMMSILGAQGMGYFNSAYEIYAMLCVISTAGLPVALSMLIASSSERGDAYAKRRIYRCALAVFLTLGGVGSAAMMLFSRRIADLIGNEDAAFCILAIAPALFCVCFSGAVRGYFQGLGRMAPTAISQLIEAICKLIFGVWFASIAYKRGLSLPMVSAFAVLGLSLGTLLSALYLLFLKAIEPREVNGNEKRTKDGTLSRLLRIAVPITLSSAVLNITRLVDMTLILGRLQSVGYSAAEANEVYGAYTTLAVPVFSLIPSLITPISLVLVPQLSAAIEARSHDGEATLADRSVRLTVLLAMPASMGIALYAKPILNVLFSNETEAVELSAPLLSLLGVSILFSGLITTTNAILQSYRSTVKPIISMAAGALVKIVSAYALLGMPSVGVFGAPVSTFLCNLTVTVMNFCFLGERVPKSRMSSGFLQIYLKPFAASVLSMLASVAVYMPIIRITQSQTLSFFAAASFAVLIYAVFAFLFRIITEDDIALIPMGSRILSKTKSKNKINI